VRGGAREFLHSRLMCWVAFDRALRLAQKRSLSAPFGAWLRARDAIREDIFTNFWNDDLQSFVQSKGRKDLDASVLLMPLMRFISPVDPMWRSTMKAIEARLVEDTLVRRYEAESTHVDGLPGGEGSFTACSFWYIECLARAGELDTWLKTLPQPWTAAMEATIFSGWIYDHLKPHAAAVKVAHPLMLRAIAASKKKNDQIDAGKLADCLRCDFLPECYMASTGIRERRRTLRCRHLLVRQVVQLKNRVSSLLMETGVSYNKQRLYRAGYFPELRASKDAIDKSIRPLLRLSRDSITRLQRIESALIRSLQRDPLLAERVRRLQTIPCVGRITALTWALEMGGYFAFPIDPTSHQLLR